MAYLTLMRSARAAPPRRRAGGRRPTEMPEAILSEMKQVRPLLGRDQAHAR
jgi:hypothetical protein